MPYPSRTMFWRPAGEKQSKLKRQFDSSYAEREFAIEHIGKHPAASKRAHVSGACSAKLRRFAERRVHSSETHKRRGTFRDRRTTTSPSPIRRVAGSSPVVCSVSGGNAKQSACKCGESNSTHQRTSLGQIRVRWVHGGRKIIRLRL